MIEAADITKFQAAYRKHFGTEISDDYARSKLSMLVRQMQAIYQPITKQQIYEYENNNETTRTNSI
jgi:hypothetical protein